MNFQHQYILENDIPNILVTYNTILSKGFDGHHFISGLASHFRDLLVCKNPATLTLLEAGDVSACSQSCLRRAESREHANLKGEDWKGVC